MAFGAVADFEARETRVPPFLDEELGVLTGVLTDTNLFVIFLGFDFDLEGMASVSLSEEVTIGSHHDHDDETFFQQFHLHNQRSLKLGVVFRRSVLSSSPSSENTSLSKEIFISSVLFIQQKCYGCKPKERLNQNFS